MSETTATGLQIDHATETSEENKEIKSNYQEVMLNLIFFNDKSPKFCYSRVKPSS